ncbi:MAG: AfsR/SARP family transcriptional regulator, partial [Brevefilum sp.]
MLEIFTLGGLCIRLNGGVVKDIGLRKAEALLVYLAVNDRPIPRSALAAFLWPEHSQAKALTSLRAALAVLNRKFPEYLDITHESVQLVHGHLYYLDVRELEQKLAAGQIAGALECFKGEFLEGFHVLGSAPFEEWLINMQTRIRDALISALHDSLTIAINTRDVTFGLMLAHKLLVLDAYDEYAHQGCMLLHAINGDRAAALGHYQRCVDLFESELGVDPQEETQKLFEMISQTSIPVLPPPAGHKHNLPITTTSFVGRRIELFQLHQKIKDPLCRLVTLVGPGGCGKTRLAIEVGRLSAGAFRDGIYFVPMEEYHSETMIIPAIAQAMNFSFDTIATRLNPENQLLDFLHRRVVLLILDGFERLAASAAVLGRMIEKVPGLKILVTSRQSLNMQREWVYVLDGLLYAKEGLQDLPLSEVEAVRLFIERSRQVKNAFLPSEEDTHTIVRICRMVEGLPLAIELAAAWVGVMSVNEIEQSLSDNLDILSTERDDVPLKHHSVRAVFESGWDLLTIEQKNLLCKLAIFESSFDHQAAIIFGDISQLSSLVRKSLMRCDQQGRFSTHNLVRAFAYEKLAQDPLLHKDVREQYCRFYLNLLAESQMDMMGAKMDAVRLTLWKDLFHLQKAAQWAITEWDPERLRRTLTSILVLYAVYGWFEGVDAFRQLGDLLVAALTRQNNPDPEYDAIVMVCRAFQAFLLTNLGQIEESEEISQSCLQPLQALGFMAEFSVCLHNLGVNATFRGEYDVGTDLLERAVLIGRESGFILWPSYLLWLGHGYLLLGEYDAGLTSLQKCRELFLRNETLWGAAFAISKIGLAYDGMGDHIKALEYHQEALSVFERIGNIVGKGYSLSRMSMSACFTGNYHLAIRFGEEAYQLFEIVGHSWGMASTLPRLGFAHLGLGAVKEARGLFLQGMNLSQKLEMAPLHLYALAGLAMTMLQAGNQETAIDLLSFVTRHPKTPMAYLEQPLSMLD